MTLQEFIKAKRGNATMLAKGLGVGQSYVSQLASGIRTVSAEYAVKIEQLSDGSVPRTVHFDNWRDIWPELER